LEETFMPKIRTRGVVVSHGGAGGPREHSDGCDTANDAAIAALREGESALEAAIRATMVLEDDPRLNAGTGSNLRLDGVTIEMDAAIMDHHRRFGAVAAIQRVQYPVRVAEMVLNTPHLMLAGEGATRFARSRGVPDYDPISERAHKRYQQVKDYFAGHGKPHGFEAWNGRDPEAFWNLALPIDDTLRKIVGPSDTVGAVARDALGNCAAALSTGGTSIMMLGRVGDTPIIGAGLYAGPHGAVAATGDGEEIMRTVLAKQVYDWIGEGNPVQEAVEQGVGLIPSPYSVGIIAVSRTEDGAADNATMPWARRELGV
jgi:isoaspartyl peptidase/L-asparaginase-like protein (Ntn-hydrolase superfamily)